MVVIDYRPMTFLLATSEFEPATFRTGQIFDSLCIQLELLAGS